MEGKGEGGGEEEKEEEGGKGKGGAEGRGREEGRVKGKWRRKPCATRRALLKAKGRSHPSWGPIAGPFWKTSRNSLSLFLLSDNTTEAVLISDTERALCP